MMATVFAGAAFAEDASKAKVMYDRAESLRKAMDYSAAIPCYTSVIEAGGDLAAKAYIGRYRCYAGRGMYGDGGWEHHEVPAAPGGRAEDFAAALADLDAAAALDAALGEKYAAARPALENTGTGLFTDSEGMQWDVFAHKTYQIGKDKDGKVTYTIEYVYKNADRICCATKYDAEGKEVNTIPYEYNAAGKLLHGVYAYEKNPMSAVDHEYDENNELIRSSWEENYKEYETVKDEDGERRITRNYRNGELFSVETKTYDGEGKLIRLVMELSGGHVDATDYEYDDLGRQICQYHSDGSRDETVYNENGTKTWNHYDSKGKLTKSTTT